MPRKASNDEGKLNALLKELEKKPDLVTDLNIHFANLVVKHDKQTFSACLTFFLLGQMYERKYGVKGHGH